MDRRLAMLKAMKPKPREQDPNVSVSSVNPYELFDLTEQLGVGMCICLYIDRNISGGFGSVSKGINKKDGSIVAVKVIEVVRW